MNLSNFPKAISLFCQYLHANLNKRLGTIGPLHKLSISVTGRCNCRCLTCDIWQNNLEESQELTIDQFEVLAKSKMVQKAKSILLTGGEPFLRSDIEQVIENFVNNTRARISIITNGLLTNRIVSVAEKVKEKSWAIDKFTLSLNGDSTAHDITRGISGSYEKTVDTIKCLKNLGFYISLIFTITKENFDQITKAYEIAKQLGVDINFYPEINSYRFDKIDDSRCLSDEQKKTALEQIENVVRKRRYYYFDDSTLYYICKTFKNKKVCDCYSGLQSAYINWDGTVYPCEGFSDEEFSFGNIKHKPFEDIWSSPDAKRVREYIKNDKCQPCFLACDIILSLRKNIFAMLGYTLKQRLSQKS